VDSKQGVALVYQLRRCCIVIAWAPLKLVHESKLCELMPCHPPIKRWEASGVLVKGRYYFVVFDDRSEVACVSDDLQPNDANVLFGISSADYGFEGISYNVAKQRFYLLVEARKHAKGCYKALIVEYDQKLKYIKHRPADFGFESANKGFEAIAHVRRGSKDFLLALCEGNHCEGGRKGRTPGGGRIQVFEKTRKEWRHCYPIHLPACLPFIDYSGMSVDGGRVAVVSQENSMLWVGHFNENDWTWTDEGRLYEFPRSPDGSILYGNIEGVGWITPSRVVTVSDRRKKKTQPDSFSRKDQSLHIFEIPSDNA
jgi:hypothetical protein